MEPAWHDLILSVPSDVVRVARYRVAQSRWRETALGLPAGQHHSGRLVGSMLPDDAPADAQWLTPHVARYVQERLPLARLAGKAIEEDRLRRNLLSSQPLCFNIFGQLAAYPAATARVLTRLLDLNVDAVGEVLVEHAPVGAKSRLMDRSAFDAFLEVHIDGRPAFLAVEVKYTEPFSTKQYDSDPYRAATDDPAGWFVPGSADALRSSATNQLWRTVMLAQLAEQSWSDSTGSEAGARGLVIVLSTEDDPHARAAVAGVGEALRDVAVRLRHITLESLTDAALRQPELRAWARVFAARYLDAAHDVLLTPDQEG